MMNVADQNFALTLGMPAENKTRRVAAVGLQESYRACLATGDNNASQSRVAPMLQEADRSDKFARYRVLKRKAPRKS